MSTNRAAGTGFDIDVLIVGAGPVWLTLANLLGGSGVRTLLAEAGDKLIDYPRGVGLDDESLRTFQTTGVVDAVLPQAGLMVHRGEDTAQDKSTPIPAGRDVLGHRLRGRPERRPDQGAVLGAIADRFPGPSVDASCRESRSSPAARRSLRTPA